MKGKKSQIWITKKLRAFELFRRALTIPNEALGISKNKEWHKSSAIKNYSQKSTIDNHEINPSSLSGELRKMLEHTSL